MGHGALGLADACGQFADGHRSFEHEVEHERAHGVAHGLHPFDGTPVHLVVEVVVQHMVRHLSDVRPVSDVRQPPPGAPRPCHGTARSLQRPYPGVMSFERPAPDLTKLLSALEEWERGETGKVLANLKTAGIVEVPLNSRSRAGPRRGESLGSSPRRHPVDPATRDVAVRRTCAVGIATRRRPPRPVVRGDRRPPGRSRTGSGAHPAVPRCASVGRARRPRRRTRRSRGPAHEAISTPAEPSW